MLSITTLGFILFLKIYILCIIVYLLISAFINGYFGEGPFATSFYEAFIWPISVSNLAGQLVSVYKNYRNIKKEKK